MTIWTQADLYYLNLRKLVKQEGNFSIHAFELEVMNVNVSDVAFAKVVCDFFSEYTVQVIAGGFLISGTMNAEWLTDGSEDITDKNKFLEKYSGDLLDKFKKLPGWGDIGGLDLTVAYNTQD